MLDILLFYLFIASITSAKQRQVSSDKNNENYKLSRLPLALPSNNYFICFYCCTISSLFVVFPFSAIDDIPLHRPYEIFPLALFLRYYFYKNEIYKNKDVSIQG